VQHHDGEYQERQVLTSRVFVIRVVLFSVHMSAKHELSFLNHNCSGIPWMELEVCPDTLSISC